MLCAGCLHVLSEDEFPAVGIIIFKLDCTKGGRLRCKSCVTALAAKLAGACRRHGPRSLAAGCTLAVAAP